MKYYVILIIFIIFLLTRVKKNTFKNKHKDIHAVGFKNINYKGDAVDLHKNNKYLLLDNKIGEWLFKSIKIKKHAIIEYIQIFNVGGVNAEHKIIMHNKNKTKTIKNIKRYLMRRMNINSPSSYNIYIKIQ
jgi:hypothetical protein